MKISILRRDLMRLWRKIRDKPDIWVVISILSLLLISYSDGPAINFDHQSSLSVLASESEFTFQSSIDISPLIKVKTDDFPQEISSEAIFIKERNSGEVIFAHNEFKPRSPASLTKMMTAIVVMQECDLSQEVVVSGVEKIGSIMGLEDGERVNYEDLLYGMLIASGNDAAELLARDCFGSEEEAVKMMNKQAGSLSLNDTHFEDVTGLSENGHNSNAYELSLIAEKLLRDDQLADIVKTKQISLVSNDYSRWYNLESSNDLLFENADVYGVKTGYTEKAGECLVIAYTRGNYDFIVTILGSEDRFGDGQKIINWLNRKI